MKTLSFANNQDRDRYIDREYPDRRETVTPYVFDVRDGTLSVFEKTLVIEPREGQGGRTPCASTGPREEKRPVAASAASAPASGSAGAFAVLRQDHERIMALAMKIRGRLADGDSDGTRRLFDALRNELEMHATIEDLHIYRVFQQADSTREAARRALDAHHRIRIILTTLSENLSAPEWSQQFLDLHATVKQHIDEEERDMFGHVSAIMTREEAHELAVALESARREITGKEPQPAGGIPRG